MSWTTLTEGLERPSLELIELTDNLRWRYRDTFTEGDFESTNRLRRERRWCQWVDGAWLRRAVICFNCQRVWGGGVKECQIDIYDLFMHVQAIYVHDPTVDIYAL
jgi:hypothetical protein